MVVAQLVEWSLSIPEVRSSNPVIGKILYWTFTVNCIEKTKIKKKGPGKAHFLNHVFVWSKCWSYSTGQNSLNPDMQKFKKWNASSISNFTIWKRDKDTILWPKKLHLKACCSDNIVQVYLGT